MFSSSDHQAVAAGPPPQTTANTNTNTNASESIDGFMIGRWLFFVRSSALDGSSDGVSHGITQDGFSRLTTPRPLL